MFVYIPSLLATIPRGQKLSLYFLYIFLVYKNKKRRVRDQDDLFRLIVRAKSIFYKIIQN